MTTTMKAERPLNRKAAERVKKLRETLLGARTDSRGARALQKNRAANPLLAIPAARSIILVTLAGTPKRDRAGVEST
ncbi:hypothetical protein [Sorangium sp. So ce176]|uniref:hypothetical protein n=1 Tax=Sorangium sp. So ce176 TaxID=3133286 RepID=UPI003F5EC220